jgi:hypothetical protein
MNELVEEMVKYNTEEDDQTTSVGIRDINKCKITNWKGRSKNRAEWKKSIKEAKVRFGL